MSSNQAPPVPPHGARRPQVHWNSDQSDLTCHRLTPEELSRKLSSRQSHNIAIARATLLSAGASSNQPFTPALAARLRAATEQSLESVIAECNAAVSNSQRIRQAVANDNGPDAAPGLHEGHDDDQGDEDLDPADIDTITSAASRVTLNDVDDLGTSGDGENGCAGGLRSGIGDVASSSAACNGPMTNISASPSNALFTTAEGKPSVSMSTSCAYSDYNRGTTSTPNSSSDQTVCTSSNNATSSHSYAQRLTSNRYPLITTNGNHSNISTYSSISSILRAKHSKNGTSDFKSSSGGPSAGALSFRNSSTSPGPNSETNDPAAPRPSSTEFQYTKDPEEARIEHEKELQRLKEDCEVESPPIESLQEVLKITQQPNRNLDKTLELVVSTCEALWSQLQQERQTRQQLQEHLQRQGAVIGDLTSELLQIQEQQEDILQEVHLARSSMMWQLAGDEEAAANLMSMGPMEGGGLRRSPGSLGGRGPMLGPSSMLAAAMADSEDRRLSSSAPPSFYPSMGGGSPLHFAGPPVMSSLPYGVGGMGGLPRHPLLARRLPPHSLHGSPKHAQSSFLPRNPGDGFS